MTLTPAQADLLARMRAASLAAGMPFCATEWWRGVHWAFDNAFAAVGIGCVEEQVYNQFFSSPPPGASSAFCEYARNMVSLDEDLPSVAGDCQADACLKLYTHLGKRDRWGALEKVKTALPEGSPRRVEINGRPLSWDVLISLASLLSIAAAWPRILEDECLVAEVGAGWGRMGFTLNQVNPAATYVIFDLPESLLLSSTYLPTVMPNTKFHFFDDTRGVPVVRDGGVWCLPAQDLAAMPDSSIDCLINIASFQEMTPEEVRAYHGLAELRVSGPLYSLQKVEHFTRMGEPVSGPKGNVPWWNYEEKKVYRR